MRELATAPAMREKAMDSASVERDSAHCTMGEGELIVDLGLWNVEGEFMDLYANLPPLLPPSLKPSVSPVPTSSPEWAAIPTSGPGRAPYPKSNPEMAPISLSSPKRDSVPESGPERAPVPKLSPERSPVPELGPERDPVPESSPKSARFPESKTKRASIPVWPREGLRSQDRLREGFYSRLQPWEPVGSKMSTHPPAPASSTAVVWQPLCSTSTHHLFSVSTTGLPVCIVGMAGEPLVSCLQPLSPGLCLAPLTQWPHHGS